MHKKGSAAFVGSMMVISAYDEGFGAARTAKPRKSHRTGGKLMHFLRWLWLIAVNVFYVIVVVYVFDRLSGRTEHIVVSILGLLYVAIRWQSLAAAVTINRTAFALDIEFARIRSLLNDASLKEHDEEAIGLREKAERQIYKIGVSSLFLSVIGLICLLDLFSHL